MDPIHPIVPQAPRLPGVAPAPGTQGVQSRTPGQRQATDRDRRRRQRERGPGDGAEDFYDERSEDEETDAPDADAEELRAPERGDRGPDDDEGDDRPHIDISV